MVMSCPASLRDRLPALWRKIEEAHYSYLETEESPEKLQQKKKLEAFVTEYLSLVPHECKFGLAETGEVFRRTVTSAGFSAYRAGLGWAAVARYAGNILAQPWRKEYRVLRTYCGYYKHEVEANLVGAESLLMVMGYKRERGARLVLTEPVCPDTVAAVSRDALIAHVECQIMCEIWEGVYGAGNVTWQDIYRARAARVGDADTHRDYIRAALQGAEIYSNISMPSSSEPSHRSRLVDPRYQESNTPCSHLHEDIIEEPINPIITQSYMIPPQMMYEAPATIPQCAPMPVMTPYGPIPYYFPIQNPYMIPTPVYPAIKHATNVPINGYPPIPQYRYPTVPTAQLIELDSDSTVYENGKHYREDDRKKRMESLRRNSTSKSGFSDVTLPSLPRSDTQPTLSKAKEDGMGTYESWDYVFRNLSSKDQDVDNRSRFSSSLDRDSRTLDRLDREERRARYQPTTLDLEDGLQALNLDRTYDDDVYRTAKVNENLMKLKQEQELKRARHLARKQVEQKKRPESIGHPKADGLIISKIAPDKVKLIPKKDKKDVVKQSSVNGSSTSIELKKAKKPTKLVALDVEKPRRPVENGVHSAHSSKSNIGPSTNNSNHELKAQLIVSLDETDSLRHSPPKPTQNGDRLPRTSSRHSSEKGTEHTSKTGHWECGTCTYLNKGNTVACEMCGKSKKGPEIEPLTSGGRECPACTLVNKRDARICDACGSSLEHCPTYI